MLAKGSTLDLITDENDFGSVINGGQPISKTLVIDTTFKQRHNSLNTTSDYSDNLCKKASETNKSIKKLN